MDIPINTWYGNLLDFYLFLCFHIFGMNSIIIDFSKIHFCFYWSCISVQDILKINMFSILRIPIKATVYSPFTQLTSCYFALILKFVSILYLLLW